MTDIERIVITSINLAKKFKHEYVTIEHLAAVILDDSHVRAMCYEIAADYEALQVHLVDYLEHDCEELVTNNDIEPNPRKTQMLERVFNRALTQALFQGKKAINQLDLILSMLQEDQSVAAIYADQLGLSKNKVVAWMQDAQAENVKKRKQISKDNFDSFQAYQPADMNPTKVNHIEVLKQFCNNMNIESEQYDDVVGRREELKDLVQTVARKKKSNAILVGASGVGKTAIVQGLAKLVVEGTVPDIIKETTVWELDMTKLVAGTNTEVILKNV